MNASFSARHETVRHIQQVMFGITDFVVALLNRAHRHDESKLVSPEVEIFDEYTPRLKDTTYGSPEYKAMLKGMAPALKHHYSANRHHPEWIRHNVEKWKDIEGFQGLCAVSNLGEVKRLEHETERSNSRLLHHKELVRKQQITPKGYLRIQLKGADGRTANKLVHWLVAQAFVGGRRDGLQVNHIDGNKKNNRASNLEWVSPSENLQHAYDTGLRKAKYVVHCVELDITTCGCTKMVDALKKRGYADARDSGILACLECASNHHLGLTFTSDLIQEWRYSSVNDMTLVDVVEMFFDWAAAVKRHADGNIHTSIDKNIERFNLNPQLAQIFHNTATAMGL